MSAPLSLPIKNTFVHFPQEPDFSPIPFRRSKSEYFAGRRVSSPLSSASGSELWAHVQLDSADNTDSFSEEDHFDDELSVERVASTQSSTLTDDEEDHFCHELQMGRVLSDQSTAVDEEEAQHFSKELKMGRVLSNQSTAADSCADWTSDAEEYSDSERRSSTAASVIAPVATLQPQPLQWIALADIGMLQQPCTLAVGTLANVAWALPAAEVHSTQNKICSSQFFVPLPGYGPCPFQIILYAEDRMCRGLDGEPQGFQRSQGRGRVEVRCLAKLPASTSRVVLDVSVGTSASVMPKRGPVTHDFAQQACCGWRRVDFLSAVDTATQSLRVCANFTLPQ